MANYDYYVKSKDFFFCEGSFIRTFTYNNYGYPIHEHDFYEINVVIEGNGTHTIHNRSLSVKKGDVFLISPNTPHSYVNGNNLTVYHIVVSRELIEKHYEDGKRTNGFLMFMEIEPFLRTIDGNNVYLHLTPLELQKFTEEIADSSLENENGRRPTLPLNIHIFFKILYRFSMLFYNQVNSGHSENMKHYEQVLNAMEYIHTNFDQKIPLELLCKICYLSRSTLLRAFEAICGCSPLYYHQKYRAKKAVSMIESSDYTKTRIAHLCGYYDLSHMERCIEKYLNSEPEMSE